MPFKESDFAIPPNQQEKNSAHTIVPNVLLKDDPTGQKGDFFIKYNKGGNCTASILEAGFSASACVSLLPGLTPPMALLYSDSGELVGLASKNVRHVVACHGENITKLRFLSGLPKGRFRRLLEKFSGHENRTIDWNSLASVLCSAYFLEEDDLHRNNIGYFIIERDGIYTLRFFKIDHDLCYSDSIMSRHAVRFWNFRHNSHSFDITRTDLLHFPNLHNYGTHYWPTRYSLLAKPCDPKIYDNLRDISAFASLAFNAEFTEAKWRQFYRISVMPEAVFAESLIRVYDNNNSVHQAYFDQILNATLAKQRALAACLFSMKPFRDWLKTASFDDAFFSASLGDIEHEVNDNGVLQAAMCDMRLEVYRQQQILHEFCDKDTPFHAAIRLGHYRFDQTWHDYGQYSKVKNAQGDTPADLLLKKCLQDGCSETARRALMDMHVQGAYNHCSSEIKAEILRLRPKAYFDPQTIIDKQALYAQITRISKDTSLTLKMKKQYANEVFRAFVSHNPEPEVLRELKTNLASDMRFAFIRLLQSRFWIFRYFRTLLLRGTTTFRQINRLLEDAIEQTAQNRARP